MSRNFIPREMNYVDLMRQKEGETSFRDMTISYSINGKTIGTNRNDAEKEEIKKQYPDLSFLCDSFPKFAVENKEYPHYVTAMQKAEETLHSLIEQDKKSFENREPLSSILNDIQKDRQPIRNIKLWYCGKLDSSFYYNEENDRLLLETISVYATNLKTKEYIEKIVNDYKNEIENGELVWLDVWNIDSDTNTYLDGIWVIKADEANSCYCVGMGDYDSDKTPTWDVEEIEDISDFVVSEPKIFEKYMQFFEDEMYEEQMLNEMYPDMC